MKSRTLLIALATALVASLLAVTPVAPPPVAAQSATGDLRVTKSGPAEVPAGQQITDTLSASNVGTTVPLFNV